jgi:hypothetical protein
VRGPGSGAGISLGDAPGYAPLISLMVHQVASRVSPSRGRVIRDEDYGMLRNGTRTGPDGNHSEIGSNDFGGVPERSLTEKF